jgi:hypothetical protein
MRAAPPPKAIALSGRQAIIAADPNVLTCFKNSRRSVKFVVIAPPRFGPSAAAAALALIDHSRLDGREGIAEGGAMIEEVFYMGRAFVTARPPS